ncbi:unnamed protein product [Closterium sp. Naga37s-1]|nr:unnamed protein product [Closterium sp. Naga37s-1]
MARSVGPVSCTHPPPLPALLHPSSPPHRHFHLTSPSATPFPLRPLRLLRVARIPPSPRPPARRDVAYGRFSRARAAPQPRHARRAPRWRHGWRRAQVQRAV